MSVTSETGEMTGKGRPTRLSNPSTSEQKQAKYERTESAGNRLGGACVCYNIDKEQGKSEQ
jgi:hypothetical protein